MTDSVIGARVGQYRLTREIGRGGMGIVYEVIHDEIGRRAAVKVLSPRCTGDPRYLRRFLDEARAISRIRHPALVQIYDFGQSASGAPYLLMELLDGETLRARIERRTAAGAPLAPAEVHRTVRQIAAALAATHRAGIVHRDLKPDNVMLVADEEAPDGERVKLLDFGIARFVERGDATLTAPGTAIGTAAYMSPEQCAGDAEIGGAADVYALGAVLHELLAGAPPFTGPTSADVMRKQLAAEPPPLPATAPAALAALVARMLAKEPTRRPAMADVVDALAAAPAPPAARDRGAPVDPTWPREAAEVTETTDADPDRSVARDRRTTPALRAAVPGTGAAPVVPAGVAGAGAPRRRFARTGVALALTAGLGAAGAARTVYRPARELHVLPGMVAIPGAQFRMGSTRGEVEAACTELGACDAAARAQLEREQPPREVTVSAFQIDAHEVTNQDYAAYLTLIDELVDVRDDRDAHYPRYVIERSSGEKLLDLYPELSGIERAPGRGFVARPGHAHRPVELVTWDGASHYCRQLGKRLPTEAEWELAAGGAEHRRFPWGDAPPRCDAVAHDRLDAGACPGRVLAAEPVATSAQDVTAAGVRDLAGNVAEWVQDQFVQPYEDCGACIDPVAEHAVAPPEDVRIVRGGTYLAPGWIGRATTRSRRQRIEVMQGLGFRCATR